MGRKFLFLLIGIFLLMPYTAHADDAQNAISVTGQFTYGSYSGSVQRRSLSSEALYVSYIPQPDFGIIVDLYHSELDTKAPLSDIKTTEPGATLYKYFKIGGTYLGGRVSATYINSNDKETNNTLVPYGSVLFKTGDSGKYLDIGYANSAYSGTHQTWPNVPGKYPTVEGSIWTIWDYNAAPGYAIANVSNGSQMLYWGGPTRGYVNTSSDYHGEVLLTFTNIPGSLPAAIKYNNLLLIGAHPDAYEDGTIQDQGKLSPAQVIANYTWLATAINNVAGTNFAVP